LYTLKSCCISSQWCRSESSS